MSRDDLRQAIAELSNPRPVQVQVEGRSFYVRVMTAFDSDQMRASLEKLKQDDGNETGRVLAFMLCDEDGALLFDAASADDVAMLSRLKPTVNTAIFNVARAANDMEGNG